MKNFVLLLTPLLLALPAFAEERGVFDYASLPGCPVAVVSAESVDALVQQMRTTQPGAMFTETAAGIPGISRALEQAKFMFVSATGLPADQLKVLLNSRCTAALLESTDESAAERGTLPVVFVVNAPDFRDESKNTLKTNLMPALILMLDGELRVEAAENDTRLLNPDGGVLFRMSFADDNLIFELNPNTAAPQATLQHDTELHKFQRVSEKLQLGSDLSGYVDAPRLLAEMQKHRLCERCSKTIRVLGIDSAAAGFHTAVRDGAFEDRIFVSLPGSVETARQQPAAQHAGMAGAAFTPPEFDLFAGGNLGQPAHNRTGLVSALEALGGKETIARLKDTLAAFEQFGISFSGDIAPAVSGEIFAAADAVQLAESLKQGIDLGRAPILIGFRTDRANGC